MDVNNCQWNRTYECGKEKDPKYYNDGQSWDMAFSINEDKDKCSGLDVVEE